MKETRTALIEMHPAGCIMVRCKPGLTQSVADAQENVAASLELSGGPRRHPLLVNITKVAPLEADVRHYYVGGALADNFLALGLVIEASPFGRMMGNVFFRMMNSVYRRDKKVGIPTRLFADEERAVAWLTSES